MWERGRYLGAKNVPSRWKIELLAEIGLEPFPTPCVENLDSGVINPKLLLD